MPISGVVTLICRYSGFMMMYNILDSAVIYCWKRHVLYATQRKSRPIHYSKFTCLAPLNSYTCPDHFARFLVAPHAGCILADPRDH